MRFAAGISLQLGLNVEIQEAPHRQELERELDPVTWELDFFPDPTGIHVFGIWIP